MKGDRVSGSSILLIPLYPVWHLVDADPLGVAHVAPRLCVCFPRTCLEVVNDAIDLLLGEKRLEQCKVAAERGRYLHRAVKKAENTSSTPIVEMPPIQIRPIGGTGTPFITPISLSGVFICEHLPRWRKKMVLPRVLWPLHGAVDLSLFDGGRCARAQRCRA